MANKAVAFGPPGPRFAKAMRLCSGLIAGVGPQKSRTMEFADLKGTWALSESFALSVPEGCRDLTIEVSDRSLRTYSGKQMITAECQIGQRHNDFVVLVSAVHVNDELGCDGATPDEVRRRYKMLQIWRPDGAGIKVLAPKPILELVKVKAPDTSERRDR